MEERVHLSVDAARDLSERALRGIGFEAEDARVVADHAIDAALCGYEYSGLPKLLNIPDSPHFKEPRSPMRLLRETSVSAMFDGGNNVGMLVMYHAAQAAIDRAAAHGVSVICVSNCWMSGRSAYFVEMIARAGLIGIHTVSASPQVAPFGGAKSALGTNPIAFGFPTAGDPLVIDMGTSAFMGTDRQFRERLGLPLPEGVALDADGRPTTDAAAAKHGALLPFGGYKGFGLAVAVEALGTLCAAAREAHDHYGYLFVAFKPDLFLPLETYRQTLTETIDTIKATPRQEGVAEIRMPGERAQRERAERLREGIEIDRQIHDALTALAESNSAGLR